MSLFPSTGYEKIKKRRRGNADTAFPHQRDIESEGIKSKPQERDESNERTKNGKNIRRGKPRKNALEKFKVMVNNVRGYKTKEVMIKRIMMEENPVLMAIVETKLKDDDAVEIPGYEFSWVNRNEDGGGVLLFFRRCLVKIMIEVAETRLHDAEILWNRLDNGKVKIKIGVVYMPQESRTKLDKLKEIYKTIEEQVAESRNNGESILILGDLNCKIGKHIQGNTDEITKGGRLLLNMVKKFKLKIVNADPCCEGRWTRIEGQCKSIRDYVIVFEEY